MPRHLIRIVSLLLIPSLATVPTGADSCRRETLIRNGTGRLPFDVQAMADRSEFVGAARRPFKGDRMAGSGYLGNAKVSTVVWKDRPSASQKGSGADSDSRDFFVTGPDVETPRVAAFRKAMTLAGQAGGDIFIILRDYEKTPFRVLGYAKEGSQVQVQSNGRRLSLALDRALTGKNPTVIRWSIVVRQPAAKAPQAKPRDTSDKPKPSQRPRSVSPLEPLATLNHDHAWSFWSIPEIRSHGRLTQVIKRTRMILRRLVKEKRIKQRPMMGAGVEYRVARSPEDFSMEDRREVVWNGVRRADLAKDPDFRKDGGRTLESVLAIPYDEGPAAVEEMMGVYDLLRRWHRERPASSADARMTSDEILHRLTTEFPGLHVLITASRIEQALRWLDIKGLALRRQAHHWWVGGLAATHYVNVSVSTWPPRFQAEWADLSRRPLSGWVVAERLRLILRMNGIVGADLDNAAFADLHRWENDQIVVDSEPFVLALNRWAERLGINPIVLRAGTSQTFAIKRLLPTLPHMANNGRRLKSLRHLEGMTQEDLAEKSGISAARIDDIERGAAKHSSSWRPLGDGLGRSHFLIVGGILKKNVMTADLPEYRRYHILRQAYNVTQDAIASTLHLGHSVITACEEWVPIGFAAEFAAWLQGTQDAATTRKKIMLLLSRGA